MYYDTSKSQTRITLIQTCEDKQTNMFEKATAMQELCSKHGYTQSKLAKELDISQSAVGNKIRLLQFSSNERAKIIAYQLTERHARALLRANSVKRAKLIDTVGKLHLNVQQTEELVDKFNTDNQIQTAQVSDVPVILQPLPTSDNFIDQTLRNADRLRNTGQRVSCLTESGQGWKRITVTIVE